MLGKVPNAAKLFWTRYQLAIYFPVATKFAQPELRRFIAMNRAFPIVWMVTAMGLAVNRIGVANWAACRM